MRQMTTGCCAQCNRRTIHSMDGLERSYFVCVGCRGEDQLIQVCNMGLDQPIAFLRDVYTALNDSADFTAKHKLGEIRSALHYIVQREGIWA